jgi:hypothetical protein
MADACANNAVNRSRRLAGILNTKSFGGDSVTAAVLATNRIVNFLVLSAAVLVLVLEWTVTCKPNVEHGKMVGYGGY